MLSPPRPSPAPAPPPPPPPAPALLSPLGPIGLPPTPSAPLSYLGAVHSLIHPARAIGVPGGGAILPPPEWPFSMLALSLAAATQQLHIALPPVPIPPPPSAPNSALSSPSNASRPLDSSSPSNSAALFSPSNATSCVPPTTGDALLRAYLRSPRSSVGQCVSWLMAAEHRVILHTTATFYTQQQQAAQPPHATASRPAGKSNSAAARRATQSQPAASVSAAPLTGARQPLLLGVGPGSADSNAPRDGEVLVADEQPLTKLKPHASSLWLQPARLSHQLLAYLSPATPNAAEAGPEQAPAAAIAMSNATAVPIDVWAVVCGMCKAGDTARLCTLLGVERIASLSQLSKLLGPHIQPLPPAPVIPPTANAASITSSTMQLMAANRAAGAAYNAAGSAPLTQSGTTSHSTAQRPGAQAAGAPSASDMPTTRRGFMAAMQLSEPLSRVVGHRFLSRPSVVRHLWAYIRSHSLQRPSEKRIIDCDPPLQEIMGTRSVTSDTAHSTDTSHADTRTLQLSPHHTVAMRCTMCLVGIDFVCARAVLVSLRTACSK